MDGVTLLESGASRAHFALVKRLDGAKSAEAADEIVVRAIRDAKDALTAKSAITSSLSESTITSQLLVVLHCIDVYPHSVELRRAADNVDCSFTLLPALHLLAVAQHARGLQIAYEMLWQIFKGSAMLSNFDKEASALLLLNTIRQHLGGHASSSKRQIQTGSNASLEYAQKYLALRSIASGLPAGPDCVPALYGPVLNLLSHADESLKARAIDALITLTSYRGDEEDVGMAKATWERIKTVANSSSKRRGKKAVAKQAPPRNGHGTDSEQLQRSLLKAAHYFLSQAVIDIDDYSTLLMETADEDATLWLKEKVMRDLRSALLTHTRTLQAATFDGIITYSTSIGIAHPTRYPSFIDAASLIGECIRASSDALQRNGAAITTFWRQCKTHIVAQNANRKMLALWILDTLLPLDWPNPTGGDDVQLDETEMMALMEMLKDLDAMVRKRALRLFRKINVDLVEAHWSALVEATRSDQRSSDVEDLTLRAVEALCILSASEEGQHSDGISNKDVARLVDLLQSKYMAAVVSEDIVLEVVAHWKQKTPSRALVELLLFTSILQEKAEALSSTSILVLATLLCETSYRDATGSSMDTIDKLLGASVKLLPLVHQQPVPLQEALLVALTKLAIICKSDEVEAAQPSVAKYGEAHSSSLVKERVRQFVTFTSAQRADVLSSFHHSMSLFATLDLLDKYFAKYQSSAPTGTLGDGTGATSKQRTPKPLQYDAYDAPLHGSSDVDSALSSVSPQGKQVPFRAMPAPSNMRSETLSKQSAIRATENQMHHSIAHLTLGKDGSEDQSDGAIDGSMQAKTVEPKNAAESLI